MIRQLVHQHTDLTYGDLLELAEQLSNNIRNNSFTVPNVYSMAKENYDRFIKFNEGVELHLAHFGYCVIFNHYSYPKGLLEVMNEFICVFEKDVRISVHVFVGVLYKTFYKAFKEVLIETECFEIVKILEQKYKRIQEVLNDEIKKLESMESCKNINPERFKSNVTITIHNKNFYNSTI